MDIARVIAEVLEHSQSPPPNEASTCEWVILPILYEIEYGKREVVARDADSAGNFPDYTLLPADPKHTFYLEAKKWKVDLEDSHANQALNYANQNGKRWVVLTNGRHWRLYDNNIHGMPPDKMVAEMHLEVEVQAVRFLEAIGRASVCEERLPSFAEEETARQKRAQEEEQRRQQLKARTQRLSAVLQEELGDQSGPLLAAMLANLRTRDGLGDLTADDLVAHFSRIPRHIENSEKKEPPTGPRIDIYGPGEPSLRDGIMDCDPENPPDLFHTRITSASIGGQDARKWNHLSDAGFRLAWQQGHRDVAEIRNWSGVNIRPGTYTKEGFHPVRDTGLSVPGMSAPKVWEVVLRIAKKLRVPIAVDFVWLDKPEAAKPGKGQNVVDALKS